MSDYAHPEVLVSTDWVRDNMGKQGIKLVEVDVDTKAYEAGHLAGSVGFNWQTQLQDQLTRDIIGKSAFEALIGGAGIGNGDTVILYGDNNNWFAAYAVWLFKIYGHRDVRLMNGGRVKWLNEPDKKLTVDPTPVTPVKLVPVIMTLVLIKPLVGLMPVTVGQAGGMVTLPLVRLVCMNSSVSLLNTKLIGTQFSGEELPGAPSTSNLRNNSVPGPTIGLALLKASTIN